MLNYAKMLIYDNGLAIGLGLNIIETALCTMDDGKYENRNEKRMCNKCVFR